MTFTWTWGLAPIILLGLLLILAPAIGAIWAQAEHPMPEDTAPRTLRARYWRWVRGRRSP